MTLRTILSTILRGVREALWKDLSRVSKNFPAQRVTLYSDREYKVLDKINVCCLTKLQSVKYISKLVRNIDEKKVFPLSPAIIYIWKMLFRKYLYVLVLKNKTHCMLERRTDSFYLIIIKDFLVCKTRREMKIIFAGTLTSKRYDAILWSALNRIQLNFLRCNKKGIKLYGYHFCRNLFPFSHNPDFSNWESKECTRKTGIKKLMWNTFR